MGSLSQLIFNFLMYIKLLLERSYFLLVLFILEDQLLSLLGLILQLRSKLVVLQHRQTSCRRELLSLQRKDVPAHVVNLVLHLILELISCLHFLPLLVSNLSQFVGFLYLYLFSKLLSFQLHFVPFAHVKLILRELALKFSEFKVLIFSDFLHVFLSHLLLLR
jgi:hypothetical protein